MGRVHAGAGPGFFAGLLPVDRLRAATNVLTPNIAGWSSLVARQAHKGLKASTDIRKQRQATYGCHYATSRYVGQNGKFKNGDMRRLQTTSGQNPRKIRRKFTLEPSKESTLKKSQSASSFSRTRSYRLKKHPVSGLSVMVPLKSTTRRVPAAHIARINSELL
jgi:hypothetical protein